jgi:ABC-type dipeptide/oligopeptide/nickel transport system permease component
MSLYLIRRAFHAILVMFGVSVIVFLALHLNGSPVNVLLPADAPQEARDALTQRLGLDQPLYEQYFSFLGRVISGDFGESLWYGEPSLGLVLDRLPATIELAALGLLISVVGAVPLGVLAAKRHRSWVDNLIGTTVMLGQSLPIFWFGLVLVLMFSVNLQWLPPAGRGTPSQIVLPAVTIGIYSMARLVRFTRSGMLDVLDQDYIRTARAKGLSEFTVIWRHGLRNALIPLVTYLGLEVGGLLGGTVVVEVIFAWPGVGRLAVESIFNRDYPLVQAVVFLVALSFVLVNLLVDLLYPVLDPRIRLYPARS